MKSFCEIYIGTYMFEASIMSHYMDVHNLEYEIIKFGHKPSFYKPYIDIVQGKMNDVGEGKFALSYSKLEGKTRVKESTKETRNTLKKNLDNFFKNRCKTKKEFNLWTTYIDAKNSIMNSRRNINFVPYNIKATNEYRHMHSMISFRLLLLTRVLVGRMELIWCFLVGFAILPIIYAHLFALRTVFLGVALLCIVRILVLFF